jgi:hypothetical protein
MRRIDEMYLGQRIVLVIALAGVLHIIGMYVVTRGHTLTGGWFGYTPSTARLYSPSGGLNAPASAAVGIGLTIVWALASIRILSSRRQP